MIPAEDCDSCGMHFDLSADNTKSRLYLHEPEYNHLYITCPGCGYEMIVSLEPQIFINVIIAGGLKVGLNVEASETIRELLDWAGEQLELFEGAGYSQNSEDSGDSEESEESKPKDYDLPEASHHQLREMFDNVRQILKEGE